MKNRKTKLFFSLLLCLAMALTLGGTALAADGTVTFTVAKDIDFAPGHSLSSTSLFDGLQGVMPGDVREQKIVIKNLNTEFDYVKVYMQALPHDEDNAPVSGAELEAMNAFLSQLSMKVWNMETSELIFNDSPDKADGLAAEKYLGQIASGGEIELKAELTVPISLGNEYMKAVGEVDWIFKFEGYDVDVLTVRKLWTGDTANHPDSVTVNLIRDGIAYDSKVLNDANQWTYTWDGLDQDYTWTVAEEPLDGYTTSYENEGNLVTITNHKEGPFIPPVEDIDLTVIKKWDSGNRRHSGYVNVTLYKGDYVYDRVRLDDSNDWRHTWYDLPGDENWRLIETSISGSYVPIYSKVGNVVTITNTLRLIQTGQLSWPIPVLCGLGLMFIGYGLWSSKKKRKKQNG